MADQPPRYRYGRAAERYLIGAGLRRLANATQHRDREAAQIAITHAQRWLLPFAEASLTKRWNEEPRQKVRTLQAPGHPEPRARRQWHQVRWWVQAWWNDGIYGADPRSEQLTAEDLITPDPSQATHVWAVNAYRRLVVDGLEELGSIMATPHREEANDLTDRFWPWLRAVVHPVLDQIPEAHRAYTEIWDSYDPHEANEVTRARRLDSLPTFHLAWHRSGIIGQRATPRDTAASEDLADTVPEAPDWLP